MRYKLSEKANYVNEFDTVANVHFCQAKRHDIRAHRYTSSVTNSSNYFWSTRGAISVSFSKANLRIHSPYSSQALEHLSERVREVLNRLI